MFVVLWEFEVKPGSEERFERVYGPGGDWDSLFHRDSHHAGTHLFRDIAKPRIYLTADYWLSRESYEAFLRTAAAEYKSLDTSGTLDRTRRSRSCHLHPSSTYRNRIWRDQRLAQSETKPSAPRSGWRNVC
jgi:heme-degrading monooxygenase HmoA